MLAWGRPVIEYQAKHSKQGSGCKGQVVMRIGKEFLEIQSHPSLCYIIARKISIVNLNVSYKRVTSTGFSELLLYLLFLKNNQPRASLVAQWLRVCLLVQGTLVRALVWEDPTCHGATRPVSHNYWACASGACALQQERPRRWKARARRWRVAPTCRKKRKPSHRNEDPMQP